MNETQKKYIKSCTIQKKANKNLLLCRHAFIFINKNKEFSEVTVAQLCE